MCTSLCESAMYFHIILVLVIKGRSNICDAQNVDVLNVVIFKSFMLNFFSFLGFSEYFNSYFRSPNHRLLARCQFSSDNYFVSKLNCINGPKSKYRRFQDMINVIQYGKTNTHVGDHHENVRSNDFNYPTRKS